jgi:beta-mannosidase
MLGRPDSAWANAVFDRVLPQACADARPDVPYVAHTPSGGALPFSPDSGVAHYYGVGAYLRGPEDARLSRVRFASECLAFANVPAQETLDEALPVPPVHHPDWKAAVPRDPGACWDFEDVRDDYLRRLTGADPFMLRREDPARYLRLSRAVTGHLMAGAFAEWRRGASACAGALVWMLQDVMPGAGWGIVDALGRAKPALLALAQVLRPVQVLLSDEGLNGLCVHVINETDKPVAAALSLVALHDGATAVASATQEMLLAPRSNMCLEAATLLRGFFDLNRAYRFGAPSHDAVVATLRRPDGILLAQSCHFPGELFPLPGPCTLSALPRRVGATWKLDLRSDRLARFVHVEDPAFDAEEGWFHLPPNETRSIVLRPRATGVTAPCGEVHALNARRSARFDATSDARDIAG